MIKKCLAWYLVLVMFVIGIAPRLEAAFSQSEILVVDSALRVSDLEKIGSVLEHKLVRQKLQDLGFTAEEIGARLSALTDQQIHDLATKLDQLKVGGDGGMTAAVVAVMVIVAAAVLVWLYVTGRWFWRHS